MSFEINIKDKSLKFINRTELICGASAKPNASSYYFARQHLMDN